MKKSRLSFYYITLAFICQVVMGLGVVVTGVMAEEGTSKAAVTKEQLATVKENCTEIKEKLRVVQHDDSRVRVYLGRYYETILSRFVMPLNVRLVENNLSDAGLIDNQSNYVEARGKFMNDFIDYQKELEELVAMDCKAEPEKFYEKLVKVRTRRELVAGDTVKVRKLIDSQVNLVKKLGETL